MLRSRLEQSLREALLNRNERGVSTLRLILAALKDRDIAERSRGNPNGLDDAAILGLLQSMVKQRQDSIRAFESGGRPELARQEADEIGVIGDFLPKQMSDGEMREAVDATIAQVEGKSLKDMGRVMATLKQHFPGQMDFARASALVKERLT
jgi:uncharacterized protein YqeY